MSRYRRYQSRRREPARPDASILEGFDTVRTPFGVRNVPRGRGWIEAGKWAMWRFMMTVLLWGTVAIVAWLIIGRVLHTPHQ